MNLRYIVEITKLASTNNSLTCALYSGIVCNIEIDENGRLALFDEDTTERVGEFTLLINDIAMVLSDGVAIWDDLEVC